MTEKDRKILLTAMELTPNEEHKIDALIDLADSEETKKTLKGIARTLYLTGEYRAGMVV
jgi:hypothetical protein